MDAPLLPGRTGPTVETRPAPRPGVTPKRKLDLSRAGSLAAAAADWFFFTPALLYLRGGFLDAHWQALDELAPGGVPLHYCRFDRPVFRGLVDSAGSAAWDAALFAVRREHAAAVSDLVCQVVTVRGGWLAAYGEQAVRVADPLAAAPGPVEVAAYGVRATDGTWALGGWPPGPVRLPPDPEAATLLAAYRRDENPVSVVASVQTVGRSGAARASLPGWLALARRNTKG